LEAIMKLRNPGQMMLLVLLLIYAAASLVHFIHNAEFLADYPNLPASWTRAGVYFVWIGMTVVGVGGWLLVSRGYRLTGLLLLAVYAVAGLDSLGHYVVAPLSDHTMMMNVTILLEVTAAALVLIEIVRQIVRRMLRKEPLGHDA
jgi:hypothetical protein